MRILVTGSAGFVGMNLCKRLLEEGHEVTGVDNFFSAEKNNIEILKGENFEFVEHDVIQPLPDLGDFDEIYHLACPASPPRYQADPIFTLRASFEGTLNLLNFAKEKDAKFLFTSTSEVYGDPEVHPQKESYKGAVNPHGIRSCYDEGKRVAESLCMNYWREFKMPIKIVRIFNTYGPYMDPADGRVVSNFIIQALKGESLTVYGDGSQTRSFQYIDDLIEGMIKFMKLEEDFPGPINIGNPDEFTILELAERIQKMINPSSEFVYRDLPKDDPMQRCPDISLAKEKLSWEPKVKLEDGLKKTIEYFKANAV